MKEGGPAFPSAHSCEADCRPCTCCDLKTITGMSLRDWYAGMALQGMRASLNGQTYPKEMVATLAYADADAMLAQRGQP